MTMDGRRYLKDRKDVSPDEVEHIIELAHRIQEDEVHPAAPMQHATGPDVEVGYLERAVALHRNLRNDAAKAAAVRAEEESALRRRVLTLSISLGALTFALIVTLYTMGTIGAADIDTASATLQQSERQLSRSIEDFASVSAELIVSTEQDPAAFDSALHRAREGQSVEDRVDACMELELAMNNALARTPAPRQIAARAQQQALREKWAMEYTRLQHESEYFERASVRLEEERRTPMGVLARFFGLVGKDL